MSNEIHDHLLALGFATELGGGGCEMLTRYLPNGVAIWVTGTDGPSLPDDADWLVCVYEPDGDSMTDARLTLASTTTPAAQYLAAISAAEAFAQVLDSQPRASRWNHAFSICFSVISEREDASDVTPAMLQSGLYARMSALNTSRADKGEWIEACFPSTDTYEMERGA